LLVIPAKAGIQFLAIDVSTRQELKALDPGFRRDDEPGQAGRDSRSTNSAVEDLLAAMTMNGKDQREQSRAAQS